VHAPRVSTSPYSPRCSGDMCRGQEASEVRRVELHLRLRPIVGESLGAIGDDGLAFLTELGARVMSESTECRSFEFLTQRVGVAIQRGNGACILRSRALSTSTSTCVHVSAIAAILKISADPGKQRD